MEHLPVMFSIIIASIIFYSSYALISLIWTNKMISATGLLLVFIAMAVSYQPQNNWDIILAIVLATTGFYMLITY